MIIFYTIEYLLLSFLIVLNINSIIAIVFKPTKFSFKINFIFIVFIINAIIFTPTSLLSTYPILSLIITTTYYILLFLYIILSNRSVSMIKSIYVASLILFIDSIFPSLVFLFADIVFLIEEKRLVTWTSSLILNIILFVIIKTRLSKRTHIIQTNIKFISKSTYVLILLSFISSGGIVSIQSQSTDNIALQKALTKILTLITIVIFMIMIISLLTNCISKGYFESISKILENQVDSQVEYYNKLDSLNEGIREFRHDYKNHMLCIQSLIENKEYEDARQYISQITNQSIIDGENFYTGNKIADSILTDKNEKAKAKNTEIIFGGEIVSNISAFEICTILSNAIDNAIEACAKIKTDTKKIISVNCIYSRGIQMIKITNPVDSELQIDNGHILTSKSDKSSHGFGLYNIQKVVMKHKGDFDIYVQDGLFVLSVGFKINN